MKFLSQKYKWTQNWNTKTKNTTNKTTKIIKPNKNEHSKESR